MKTVYNSSTTLSSSQSSNSASIHAASSSLGAVSDCSRCYVCCLFCGAPPFETRQEREALPEELRIEVDDYWAQATDLSRKIMPIPCLWLDCQSGLCKHYEYRPDACRKFLIAEEECLILRKAFEI